jgi:hypothetical protein
MPRCVFRCFQPIVGDPVVRWQVTYLAGPGHLSRVMHAMMTIIACDGDDRTRVYDYHAHACMRTRAPLRTRGRSPMKLGTSHDQL